MRLRTRTRAALLLTALVAGTAIVFAWSSGDEPHSPERVRVPRHSSPAATSQFIRDRDRFHSADNPDVVAGMNASFLLPEDEVYGVVIDGRARAYPLFMLAWHHVINDKIGNRPLAVTYCILCSSGIVFDPVVAGRRLTFDVDGAWQGTATLFDRETDSLWLQVTGECIRGAQRGAMLTQAATGRHTTWLDWLTSYPNTDVMRPVRGERAGSGPFGYFTRNGSRSGMRHLPAEVAQTIETRDERMPSNALVYGVEFPGVSRAYPFEQLRYRPIVEEVVAGQAVTVWFDPVHRSVAGFSPRSKGRTLHFTIGRGGLVQDRETGSTWNMEGACVAGPLKGQQLAPLTGLMAEWYGWFAHYPDTQVWQG